MSHHKWKWNAHKEVSRNDKSMIGGIKGVTKVKRFMVTFQDSPMNVNSSENIKHIEKTMVVIASEWLGKEISDIVC